MFFQAFSLNSSVSPLLPPISSFVLFHTFIALFPFTFSLFPRPFECCRTSKVNTTSLLPPKANWIRVEDSGSEVVLVLKWGALGHNCRGEGSHWEVLQLKKIIWICNFVGLITNVLITWTCWNRSGSLVQPLPSMTIYGRSPSLLSLTERPNSELTFQEIH